MGQSEQNGTGSDQRSHFPSRLDCYLAGLKPYLLLLLKHMTLLLLNYFELNFILGTTFFPDERSNLWKGVATYF